MMSIVIWEQEKKKKEEDQKYIYDEYGNRIPKPHAAWGVVPVLGTIAAMAAHQKDV